MKTSLLVLPFLLCLGAAAAAAGPEVNGHRGARGMRPENTLPAFDEALRAGADGLEFDVVVTSDNVVAVHHDPYVNPEFCLGPGGAKIGASVAIRTLTLAQLKEYDCGTVRNSKFPRQVPVPGTRMPTLEETFRHVLASTEPAAAKVKFIVEIKTVPGEPELTPAPDAFAALVAAQIEKAGVKDRCVVMGFDRRVVQAMKRALPGVKTTQLLAEDLADPLGAARRAGADIIGPNYKWITAEDVAELHKNGVGVVVWTANDPRAWAALAAAGVDGITTDYPADLIAWLKAKGLR